LSTREDESVSLSLRLPSSATGSKKEVKTKGDLLGIYRGSGASMIRFDWKIIKRQVDLQFGGHLMSKKGDGTSG